MAKIRLKLDQLKAQIKTGTSLSDALKQDMDNDMFLPSDQPNMKKHEFVYSIIQDSSITAYTDLTGRFPYRSSRGNEYILVGYHYDSNAILVQPLGNREAKTITNAW